LVLKNFVVLITCALMIVSSATYETYAILWLRLRYELVRPQPLTFPISLQLQPYPISLHLISPIPNPPHKSTLWKFFTPPTKFSRI